MLPDGSLVTMDLSSLNELTLDFCDKFVMQNMTSSPYNPAANGQAKAFNKTIVKFLQKLTTTT